MPIHVPANYSYSRKAHYHYGWDWGPRLVTAGIWKDVKLESYDTAKINGVNIRTLTISDGTYNTYFSLCKSRIPRGFHYLISWRL
jgi:beta-mannosidase